MAGTGLPPFPGAHPATVRQSHPTLRAALSFQRMRQQLQILRLLTRQSHPASDARGGRSAARSARAQGTGLSQRAPGRR